MAEEIQVQVRSNVDALSADRLHQALFRMVAETVDGAGAFLLFIAPERSGDLKEHLKFGHAQEMGEKIRAILAVPEIHTQDERPTFGRFTHARYPLAVEEGTADPRAQSIFPAVKRSMWNRPDGIFHRRSVAGQEGQHFMARTYAEAVATAHANTTISDSLRAMALQAAAELPVVER